MDHEANIDLVPKGHGIAIGVAGGIGSGKTTLIQNLKALIPLQVASYGDYVRSIANDRDKPTTREALQSLSNELLTDLGHARLAEVLVNSVGWTRSNPLLIDGIRHLDAIVALKEVLAPASVYLIFVDTPTAVRMARILGRDGTDANEARLQDQHETESQVMNELRSAADLRLNGTDLQAGADQVVAALDLLSPIGG